ncbi:hypothetical protein ACP70R_019894 [Stipagrostis hirtigluma subsp. patula]
MSEPGDAVPSPPLRRGRGTRRPMGTRTGSTERPPASPSLPPDILRDVLARCDHETLVRCAASSRLLCRCMLDDPAFLRRCAAVAADSSAPSLLLGFFHGPIGFYVPGGSMTRFVEAPGPLAAIPRAPVRSFLSDNADLLRRFDEPVACRGGLVVLRRRMGKTEHRTGGELCVCDPMTGRGRLLPLPAMDYTWLALLTGDDDAGPFQLLAVALPCGLMEWRWGQVRTQLFSSTEPFPAMPAGEWGPVRGVALPFDAPRFSTYEAPLVINGVAHFLTEGKCGVLTVRAGEGRAGLIKAPAECARPGTTSSNPVILARTADRRLSMVVVEELVITLFVLSSPQPGSWERRAAVVREGILAPPKWIRLDSFGERSGTVAMCADDEAGRRYFLLKLETMEVAAMPPEKRYRYFSWPMYLYETDLPSLAAALADQ